MVGSGSAQTRSVVTLDDFASMSCTRLKQSLSAGAVREGVHAGQRDLAGLHEVAFALHDAGELELGHREEFVLGVGLREGFERGLVASVLLLADGLVPAEAEPVQVGVEKRGLVRVVLVEGEQLLVELDGLDRAVVGVGGLRLPLQELVDRVEDGAIGRAVRTRPAASRRPARRRSRS